jgi:putative transposase
MPNHVHLVAVPQSKDGLAKLFGVVHHRHALRVNSAQGWQGHLWQERYHSSVLDEAHLIAAVRYIELNPVRAGLCARAEDWRWSSVHAHLWDTRDDLVNTAPMRERIPEWRDYLLEDESSDVLDSLRVHTRSGRPAGDDNFVEQLEALTGQRLRRRRPGPESEFLS